MVQLECALHLFVSYFWAFTNLFLNFIFYSNVAYFLFNLKAKPAFFSYETVICLMKLVILWQLPAIHKATCYLPPPSASFCIFCFSFLPLLALFLQEYNKKTTSYMFFLCTLYCNGHISVVILIWKTHCMPVYNGNLNPAGGSYFIFIEVVYRELSTQMKCSDRKGGDMPWNQIMPDSQAASLRITGIQLSSQAFISLFLRFRSEWRELLHFILGGVHEHVNESYRWPCKVFFFHMTSNLEHIKEASIFIAFILTFENFLYVYNIYLPYFTPFTKIYSLIILT